MTSSTGDSPTHYGFTGECTDPSGLTYLRARYYNLADGRFMNRDTWAGDVNNPLSLNRWMYVEGNPVNYVDPTRHFRERNLLLRNNNLNSSLLLNANVNLSPLLKIRKDLSNILAEDILSLDCLILINNPDLEMRLWKEFGIITFFGREMTGVGNLAPIDWISRTNAALKAWKYASVYEELNQ